MVLFYSLGSSPLIATPCVHINRVAVGQLEGDRVRPKSGTLIIIGRIIIMKISLPVFQFVLFDWQAASGHTTGDTQAN